MGNFEKIAQGSLDTEKEIQDINKHTHVLKQEKIWLENEIKDLEEQAMYDNNETSLEDEIQNKKKRLVELNNEIDDFLGKDKEKDQFGESESNLN